MGLFKSGTAVATILALLLALAVSPAAFAQAAWSPTATKGISLSNATDLGPLPAQTPLHIVVALQMRNMNGLRQLVQQQNDPNNPLYGTELEPASFAATYGPTSNQVSAVSNYLSGLGFTNIQVEPNNLLVTAAGTAAAASAAFNTPIEQFNYNGDLVYANTQGAKVPLSLGGTVVAVLGLNTVSKMSLPSATTAVKVCGPVGGVPCPANQYTPQQLWQAYDVGATPTGAGTKVAIFTFGGFTSEMSDLRIAETQNKLPQVPVVLRQVGIPNPTELGGGEWQLDMQASTGMAANVKTLYVYQVTNPFDSDTALMFNRFVTEKLARAGSASFGLCEAFAYLDGSMLVDDMIFLQGAAQGQSVFVSTGDQGSACGVSGATNGAPLSGVPGAVEYPASSPYVVAVGGTTLFTDNSGNYVKEFGWDAGGGGISAVENCTFWQTTNIVPSCANSQRGLPDVAMDADFPLSTFIIYMNCAPNDPNPNADCRYITGGTSLSAPLALGVWARLQSGHGNKLGYASPKFYSFYKPGPPPAVSGFHDIIGGCNGAYCAIPGWDYVTGLGTFDVAGISGLFGPVSTGAAQH